METEQFTFFWSNSSPFSNWYKASFVADNITFNCAEQYMMYHKARLFDDKDMAREILKTTNPGKQKALGRKVINFDITIWNQHCKKIVYDANHAKFTQNKNLLKQLGSKIKRARGAPADFSEVLH